MVFNMLLLFCALFVAIIMGFFRYRCCGNCIEFVVAISTGYFLLLVWSSVLLLCSFLFCFVSHWLLFIWYFVLFITVRVLFVTVRVVFVAVSCGVCFCLVFVLLFLYGRCCYFVFFGVAVVFDVVVLYDPCL